MTQGSAVPRADILVVDDDHDTLATLAVILGDEGHQVTTADSGRKALELCRLRRFDCMLLDVTLGDVTGLSVARILAQNPNMRPGHVVLLSGHPREDFLHELRNGLVDGYVSKSGAPGDLAATIGKALAKARYLH